jgi:GNAT superfamily N-acetyltransferase
VELRPTTAADLPALHALFRAAIGGVFEPHGFESPAPPLDVFSAQQRHLIDTGTCVVAEAAGTVVGFASAWTRGEDWFLASLFVDPSAQGRGLGVALLDAVWDERALRRRTITDAIQPVSNALYGRHGLIPVTPVLSFSGTPTDPRGLLERFDGTEETALAAIDAAAYGFDRAVDHAYWASIAPRTLWARDGCVVAYSYAFPGGTLGPVAGLTAADAADALDSALAAATGPVGVRVPGSAREVAAVALRRGLRLSPTPGLLLCSAGAEPPTGLAIGSFTLL